MTQSEQTDTISGTISVHPRGFGFLNFEMEGEPASAFVVPPDLNPFLSGDRVQATLIEEEDGRYSARDLRLESRVRAVVFGEVLRRKGGAWLKIDDEVANTDRQIGPCCLCDD